MKTYKLQTTVTTTVIELITAESEEDAIQKGGLGNGDCPKKQVSIQKTAVEITDQ